MENDLPARYKPLLIDDEENVFDSILVFPKSTGVLHVEGVYSKADRHPGYEVIVEAPNMKAVKHEEIILGDDEAYTVTVEVTNRSDAEALVRLQRPKLS